MYILISTDSLVVLILRDGLTLHNVVIVRIYHHISTDSLLVLILRDGLTLHNVHIYLSYFHTRVLFILHNGVTSHTSSFIYISNSHPPTGSSNLSLIKCFLKVILPMQTERRLCYTSATNEGRAQVINLNYLPQPKTMHE